MGSKAVDVQPRDVIIVCVRLRLLDQNCQQPWDLIKANALSTQELVNCEKAVGVVIGIAMCVAGAGEVVACSGFAMLSTVSR